MEAFLAAVGSMVQYAREDEALQLQAVSHLAFAVLSITIVFVHMQFSLLNSIPVNTVRSANSLPGNTL